MSTGPARVIASGSATTFGGHPLSLAVEAEGEVWRVELAFVTDGGPGPAVVSTPLARGFELRCVNFDGGRGTREPMLLGEVADDLLFLHFRAFRHGTTVDTTVQYTLYRVAKADVGWVPRTDSPFTPAPGGG